MCSISVEPMPSTMSTPKWRLKRSPISAGSASPADESESQRHILPRRQNVGREQAGVAGRRAVEHRRPDAADAAKPRA